MIHKLKAEGKLELEDEDRLAKAEKGYFDIKEKISKQLKYAEEKNAIKLRPEMKQIEQFFSKLN